MKQLKWPETMDYIFYRCQICGQIVSSETNMDNEHNIWYTPESRYWNVQRKEVYCSALHSLQREIECNTSTPT